jgi:hypothetical protein
MPLLKRLHVETDEVYVCSFTAPGSRLRCALSVPPAGF